MLITRHMLPTSMGYITLFAAFLLFFYIFPPRIRKFWLLIGCTIFIGALDFRFAVFAFLIAFLAWFSGYIVSRSSSRLLQKAVIIIYVLCLFLGVLWLRCSESAHSLLESELNQGVVIPVGLMVYSLKSVNYVENIYRNNISSNTSFIDCTLYILFFPALTFGPIDTPNEFLTSLNSPQKSEIDFNLRTGFLISLWGLFLKIVVADNIGVLLDVVVESYSDFNGTILLLASFLFTVQMYCTFYGFSAVATGLSRMLGFRMPDNFNAPLLRTSIFSTWQNWNITFNRWFADNLIHPLMGEHTGKSGWVRKAIVYFSAVVLMSLWYGTENRFLLWGMCLFGVCLVEICCSKAYRLITKGNADTGIKIILDKILYCPCVVINLMVISLAGLLFRSNRIMDAVSMLRRIVFTQGSLSDLNDTLVYLNSELATDPLRYWILIAACIIIVMISDICRMRKICISAIICEKPFAVRCFIYLFMTAVIAVFGCWGNGTGTAAALCDFLQ